MKKLSQAGQKGVLQDSGQHVTVFLNSLFISSHHRSNLFLNYDGILELRDVSWVHAYCMGVQKEIVKGWAQEGGVWKEVKRHK